MQTEQERMFNRPPMRPGQNQFGATRFANPQPNFNRKPFPQTNNL